MNKNEIKKQLNDLLSNGLEDLRKNNPKEALKKFKKILVEKPDNSNILNFVGICYSQLKSYEKALSYINKAISINKKEVGFYLNLGNVYKNLKNFPKALEVYLNCLKINKASPDLYYNIGILYENQNKFSEALIHYKKTIELEPLNKFALNNIANVYKELSLFNEAIELYKKAISIDKNYLQAHFNLGLLLLLTSNSRLGWEKYEYRENKIKNLKLINSVEKWQGSNLENKKLLIICEQGIGDSVQFIRYVKKIKKSQSKIFLLIKKNLISLFENMTELDEIFENEDDIPYIDFYIPLMSLPFIFRNDNAFPPPYNFLKQKLKKKQYWKNKLDINTNIKIGIVWQGDKINNKKDFKRSIDLKMFKPILEIKKIEFISLQKDQGREQIYSYKLQNLVTDFYGNIDQKPFEDTVPIIDSLNMVISVDTSLAHISASMEKETWLLIPKVPDFRWGLESDKTVWYSKVKLYRQKKINDWSNVFKAIKEDLIRKYNLD